MKIFALGFYGKHNVGDESYKLTLPKLFPTYSFEFGDHYVPGDHEMVVLGGGNVLQPYFFRELARVKNKPIYAVSVGIEDGIEIPNIFRHIYVRDQHSLDVLKQKGLPCSLIPDLAYNLTPDRAAGHAWIRNRFVQERLDLYSKRVAVVINSYLIFGGSDALARDADRFRLFAYDLAAVFDRTSASFIFLPFGTHAPDDRVANGWIAHKCKFWNKNHAVFDRLDVQTTLNVISACDLVISTRLHSSIFAHLAQRPFIDIVHHSKNGNFLETLGKQGLSYWEFSVGDFEKIVKSELGK